MIRTTSLTRLTIRLLFLVPLAALLYRPLPGLATAFAPSLGSASGFAVLAGTAVTCSNSHVTGNVGVWPGTAVTRTGCPVAGTVYQGGPVAEAAFTDFINAYNNLLYDPPPCDYTVAGTLGGETLLPGVYCVDAVAKKGTLILDANGDANAVWIFLVDGALTGTNFNVVMINGGQPCNVYWRTGQDAAATLTDSNFLGTILSGAAITITRGSFRGDAFATVAVTLTNTDVTACPGAGGGTVRGKCNQGVGNGAEGCDPGNSNNHNPSNDERGGTPGDPGRKPRNR